jgi:hypothetical protein
MACDLMISLGALLMLLPVLGEALNHHSAAKHVPIPISAAIVDSSKSSELQQLSGPSKHLNNRRSTLAQMLGCASSSTLMWNVAEAADTTCNPPSSVLDARSQLDLAVQASSVQAWSDAAEIVQDESLDERNLVDAFQNGGYCNKEGGEMLQAQLETSILDAISSMKQLLASSNKKMSTEDAMAVMKYGTSARVAIDSYFGL